MPELARTTTAQHALRGGFGLRGAIVNRGHRWTVLAFLGLLATSTMTIGGLIYFAARSEDRVATDKSETLVHALLLDALKDVGRATLDYGWWTDAYLNLVVKPSGEWANQILGTEVSSNFDVTGSFVVDGDGRTTFAFIAGKAVDFDLLRHAQGGLDQLIASARSTPYGAPKPHSGLIAIDGVLQAAAAAAVLPDPASAEPPQARSVLIFVRAINQSELDELARGFSLPAMSFGAPNEPVHATTLPLKMVDGRLFGTLSWRAEGFGAAMVHSLMAPMGIAFLVLALLSVAVLTQIERTRRRFDEQLRLSEERFRSIFGSVSEGIFIVDAMSGAFIEVNEPGAAMLGYAAGELIGRDIGDISSGVPPYTQQAAAARFGKISASGRPDTLTWQSKAKDGHLLWTEVSLRSASIDNRGVFISIVRDITERMASEQALRREHDRAQRYLDIARVMIVVVNADETVALVNRRACEVLGVTEADAVGQNWYDAFIPEDRRDHDRAAFRGLIDHGSVRDVDGVVLTRYGEVRIISWHETILRADDGGVIGTIGSGEDITERRTTERKRDEFRALIEATAEATPDAILVTDTTGRPLFWNRHFRERWDVPDEHIRQGQKEPFSAALLAPITDKLIDPEGFQRRLARVFAKGFERENFGELHLKDGRVLMTYAARVEVGDPPFGVIAWIDRDITEQKKRQAELAQSQRLNAIGKLAGGVAHDFNNLLTVISGNLELIKESRDAGAATAELADAALAAAERGADVTRRLLAFSRHQPLDPRLTDVNALAADVAAMLPRLLGETIELRFAPGANLWRTVVDRGQLQTALMNLVTNARDAMPKGGSLAIETENVSLDGAYTESLDERVEPGDYVMIAVSDDGQGMAPEVARRVFEPFFTTKPVGKGTGLGLSMVYGFVRQSGGHVTLSTEEGLGTKVKIYLPRAADAALQPVSPQPAPYKVDHGAVLLVEDDPAVSRVAKLFLEDIGFRVIEAKSGPSALEIVRQGDPIDLLFTDVVLPDGMSGAEVARAAQALRPGLKVLFASGYSEHALMYQARLADGVVLLQKPYRKQELAAALRRVLEA